MKLYARAGSFQAQKVLIAAQYAGAKVDVVTNAKESELKGKAAADRLPILETEKGSLFESNAIMRFIAAGKAALVGADAFQKAQIDSWVDFGLNEIETPAMCLTYPVIGWMENYPEVTKRAQEDIKAALTVLENYLKSETFLVGRQITLADIAVATALILPFKIAMGDKERKPFPCVVRWFTTCVNQPEFVKVVGPVTLPKQGVAPKAAAPAPKAAPAAAPAAPAEEEEAPAKPAKHPLEALPKSSFILDAWKKYYSNSKDLYGDAMTWFWQNFDKEGYALFKSDYNYNDELKINFQVSNLVTGFLQRCDEIRKYAFGVMNIVGQNGGPMEIHGMWLVRGQDVQAMLDANPDAEYHTWTKITDFSDENKKMVANGWCAEEELFGKPIIDCKVFK